MKLLVYGAGVIGCELSNVFRDCLSGAFSGAGCKLTWENHMDAWLKYHMAEILPVGYVSYAVGCSLPKASKAQRKAMVDATAEGFALLKALGRLAVTDHCAHAVSEMTMLDRAWEELRAEKKDTLPMTV